MPVRIMGITDFFLDIWVRVGWVKFVNVSFSESQFGFQISLTETDLTGSSQCDPPVGRRVQIKQHGGFLSIIRKQIASSAQIENFKRTPAETLNRQELIQKEIW